MKFFSLIQMVADQATVAAMPAWKSRTHMQVDTAFKRLCLSGGARTGVFKPILVKVPATSILPFRFPVHFYLSIHSLITATLLRSPTPNSSVAYRVPLAALSEDVNGIVDHRPDKNVRHGTPKHLLNRKQLSRAFWEVLLWIAIATECHDSERGDGGTRQEEEKAPQVCQPKNSRGHSGKQRAHRANLANAIVVLSQFPTHKPLVRHAHCCTKKTKEKRKVVQRTCCFSCSVTEAEVKSWGKRNEETMRRKETWAPR